ncbi:MAG: hypothetical protein ACREB3_01585 [Burkholderiales bacterium]
MNPVKRQEIVNRLEEIRVANAGRLTAEAVVEDARDKASPLHSEFEWRQKEAAYQHWLDTARHLITSFRVVVTEEVSVRAPKYVRDPRLEGDEQGYVSLYSLQSDEDAAMAVINSEFGRVESALRRAQGVAEVLGLKSVLDDLLAQILVARKYLKKAA